MNQVFIGLGTNIEPREEHIHQALKRLDDQKGVWIREKSTIYETAPKGYTDQSYFLNMVVKVDSSLVAKELLSVCKAIEKQLGRKKTFRFGPRVIDLDILVYNQDCMETERLTIPHPRMHERAFVLIPLGEISSNMVIPKHRKSVFDLINDLSDEEKEEVVKWG